RKLHQGRRRRRQPMRTGLLLLRQEQGNGRLACEGRDFAGRQRNQRYGKPAAIGDDGLQFGCLAAPGNGQNRIPAGNHAEIAMSGFGGVDERSRRSGGGERGGHLGPDMPALADAGDDDAPGQAEDNLYSLPERLAEPVLQGPLERFEALSLYPDGPQGGFDHVLLGRLQYSVVHVRHVPLLPDGVHCGGVLRNHGTPTVNHMALPLRNDRRTPGIEWQEWTSRAEGWLRAGRRWRCCWPAPHWSIRGPCTPRCSARPRHRRSPSTPPCNPQPIRRPESFPQRTTAQVLRPRQFRHPVFRMTISRMRKT